MNKQEVAKALKQAKESAQKRNFNQSIDLIITLKGLDLKKNDQHVDFFMNLHNARPKKVKVCGLVGPELSEASKEAFDHTITVEEFSGFKDKRSTKKLARSYDFFVAQGNIMAKVAQTFGRSFGPKGKMPNPKGGMVVPPNANLKAVYEKLQSTLHVKVKSHLMYQVSVGYEDTPEEEVIDNIMTVYDQLIHHLPQERNNYREGIIKLTMGKSVKIDAAAKKAEEKA